MSTIFNDSGATPGEAVSEFEEQVWLEHQQQRHGEGQIAFAWRLGGEIDYGRLVAALTQTLARLPGAQVCYRYDDDGGLRRYPASASSPAVAIQPIRHYQQAIDALLRAKATPFDLALTPPLRFILFTGDNEGVLGIVAHRIVCASLAWRDVIQGISARYQGQEPPPLSAVAAARATPMPGDGSLSELFSPAPLIGCPRSGVSLRAQLFAPGGEARRMLADCAARFAATLSEMTGSAGIALYLAAEPASEAAIAPPLMLTCAGRSAAQLASRLRRHLCGEEPLPTAQAALPPLRVIWRDDAASALRLGAAEVAPLPLPPGHTGWPVTVTIAGDGQAEVIVGARLSGWLAESLLSKSYARQPESAASPAAGERDAGDEICRHILEAFREALALPAMGENDDFFDAGGHSLIATRIIGRLKSLHGIEININDLFSRPNAARLAACARIAAPPPAPLPQARAAALLRAPLSVAQKSLWKIYQALGFSAAFNIPFALRFLDPIDEDLFRQAFADMLLRHPALRTLFVDIDGEIYQQVVPPERLAQYEWFWFSPPQPATPFADALQCAADHRFSLDSELPIRIRFLRDEENGQQVVSLLFHHLVLDEWSVNILLDELALAVASRSAGRAPQWRQTPAPFHDFAIRQRAAGLNDEHLRFWLDRLRGAPAATPILSGDGTRDDDADPRGGWVEFSVERAVSDGLYRLAKQQGASLFNVVYGGIAAALHLLGGMQELLIGTSASGRNDAQFFDTVGYFTTVVAHRIDFGKLTTLNELVDEVKRQINDSLPYSDIPVDLIEEGLFGDNAARDRHMFEVFIQIHAKNKLNGAFTLADGSQARFRQVDPQKTESVLGLQFEVMEEQIDGEPSIRVLMSYRSAHYSPQQVRRIVRATRQLFAALAGCVGKPALPFASLRERVATTQ